MNHKVDIEKLKEEIQELELSAKGYKKPEDAFETSASFDLQVTVHLKIGVIGLENRNNIA